MTQCPVKMDYDWSANKYIARESKSGLPLGSYQTLTQYDDYVRSLGCVSQYPPGTTLTPTGFLEFAARDPATQSKYDAMSPSWEGPKASEAAITRGMYDLDFETNPKSRSSIQPSGVHTPSYTLLGTLGIRNTATNSGVPHGR